MKYQVFVLIAGLLLLGGQPAHSQAQPIRLDSKVGGKMRIEGTSSVHDWQVESGLIGGYLEVGGNFPLETNQTVTPGKTDVRAEVFIPVRQLKSIEKDGKPYSDSMNEKMWEKLKLPQFPKIIYRLAEMTLKETPKANDAAYVYDSKGDLVIAGVTNNISMIVRVTPLGDKRLKITGTVTVKMTDFGIQPPSPALAMGLIKTGDEVKLFFEWLVGPKAVPKD